VEREIRSRRSHLVFIGWHERLDADFATLVELLGLPIGTTLPGDEYIANRGEPTNAQSVLPADALAILRDWYAEDYRLISVLAELGLTDPPPEVRSMVGAVGGPASLR